MDKNSEAAFEDALDSALEETIEEVDVDVEAVEEDSEDESEESSQADDPESEDDSEEVDEDADDDDAEDEGVEQADATPAVEKWNGNPDELPPAIEYEGKLYDLRDTLKAMQGGFTKKTQEIAEQRKKYEEATQQAMAYLEAQKQQAREAEDPRPENPVEGMTPEQIDQRWDEINRWIARDENRRMVKDGIIPDPDAVRRQMEQQEQAMAGQRRMNLLKSDEAWSEQVEEAMINVAENSEYWQAAIQSDEGALALLEFVKQKLSAEDFKKKAAEYESAKVKRSAQASKRATPKQSGQTKKAEVSPAERFKDMGFDEKLEAIVDDEFGL